MELTQDIWNKAIEAGRIEAQTPEAHWFPCGFAWLAFRCRKNAKISKTLIALGFRWDDYAKHYYTSLYQDIQSVESMWQSMDYRARILRTVAKSLRESGVEDFYVDTRID